MALRERFIALLAIMSTMTLLLMIVYNFEASYFSLYTHTNIANDHGINANYKWNSNKFNPLNASFTFKYFYYADNDNDTDNDNNIFTFFEQCSIGSWGKNSAEHYFMKQLKENKNGNRVYNCFEADIFVIPLSLGNLRRHRCGLQTQTGNYNKTIYNILIANIFKDLNDAIFDNRKSCWNKIGPRSHSSHFMMAGASKGEQFLFNDQTHFSLRSAFGNNLKIGIVYKHFILANTNSIQPAKGWEREEDEICTVSSGYTSIISDPAMATIIEHIMNIMNISISLQLQLAMVQYKHLNLNEIYVSNININSWRRRKHKLFFMGQADDRKAYKSRVFALKYLNKYPLIENNVLIITEKYATYNRNNGTMPRCNVYDTINSNSNNLTFPCSTTTNKQLYIKLLAESKFNLMFRGDEPCSSRFYDAIALNVINIVISDDFRYCLIGYNIIMHSNRTQIFLQIKEKDFDENPYDAVNNVISQYDESYFERMLQEMNIWKKYILWDTINSQTAQFMLAEAITKCIPQSSSPYI